MTEEITKNEENCSKICTGLLALLVTRERGLSTRNHPPPCGTIFTFLSRPLYKKLSEASLPKEKPPAVAGRIKKFSCDPGAENFFLTTNLLCIFLGCFKMLSISVKATGDSFLRGDKNAIIFIIFASYHFLRENHLSENSGISTVVHLVTTSDMNTISHFGYGPGANFREASDPPVFG